MQKTKLRIYFRYCIPIYTPFKIRIKKKFSTHMLLINNINVGFLYYYVENVPNFMPKPKKK